jgi:hypothetical protein
MPMVATGLWKFYAKMEVGKSFTELMFIDSRLQVLITSLQDQNTLNTYPGFDYQTMIEQY